MMPRIIRRHDADTVIMLKKIRLHMIATKADRTLSPERKYVILKRAKSAFRFWGFSG